MPGRHAAPPIAAPEAAAVKKAPPSRPSSYIRIGLQRLSGRPEIEVKALTPLTVLDADAHKRLLSLASGQKARLVNDLSVAGVKLVADRKTVSARGLTLVGGVIGIGKRKYPGKIHFTLGGAGLDLVNELEIEQYLEGVLPGELPRGFGLEAQKAQAVAARTYALVQHGKHGDFDLCDRTHCQMYVGMTKGTPRALQAVRSTRHQVLWYQGKLAYAFYSADCGGESARVDDVPLKDKPAETLPYLTTVKDAPPGGADYCCTSPYHEWTRRFTRQQLQDKLNSEPETYVGQLREVKFLDYDPSGRVNNVLLRGVDLPPAGTQVVSAAPPGTPIEKRVSGWIFRRSVGPVRLASTLMKLDQPDADTFRFRGSGFGHGLGLCQIGANGMAQHGKSYRDILAHYYPGTKLAPLPK
jgi:stage II sporulation protein D